MRKSRIRTLWIVACSVTLATGALIAQSQKNRAQQLIDQALQKHPEVTGLELSTTPAGQSSCLTIAATDPKDLGEKCDEDEAAALKSGKPFVEHEPDGYDVTAPLHDANGKVIGTLGIDIKPIPGQTKKNALKITNDLLKEIEPQIPSEASLFEPAS